jgi:hypothetical protein
MVFAAGLARCIKVIATSEKNTCHILSSLGRPGKVSSPFAAGRILDGAGE